jgi:SAM-dependent methyltransferase
LQISEIPANIDKYYPPHYYSLSPKPRRFLKNPVEKALRRFKDYHTVFNRRIFGRLISSLSPNKKMTALSRLDMTTKSRVLDVGCGDGWRLNILREIGFETILGIDPYILQDITYENGVTVKKKSIHEVTGEWDVIMYHHSFEHVPDPHEQLQRAAKLLSPGGCCLLRLPTVSSYAWEHYRENWFQLDAPRHFFLHSIRSIALLAEKAGLSLQDIVFDSTADQFQGSELYKRDIPFIAQANNFTRSQVREWKSLAKKLNKEKRGDQAAFYLIKK